MCDSYSHGQLEQLATSCLKREVSEKLVELEKHLQECDDCLIIFGYAIAIEGKIDKEHPFYQLFNLVYRNFETGKPNGLKIQKSLEHFSKIKDAISSYCRLTVEGTMKSSIILEDEKKKQRAAEIAKEMEDVLTELDKIDCFKDEISGMMYDFRNVLVVNFPRMKFLESIISFTSLQVTNAKKLLSVPTGDAEVKIVLELAKSLEKRFEGHKKSRKRRK